MKKLVKININSSPNNIGGKTIKESIVLSSRHRIVVIFLNPAKTFSFRAGQFSLAIIVH